MSALINLNDQFTVVLTAEGAQQRNDHYEWIRRAHPEIAPALCTEGDAITEPLWELMKVFGPHMAMTKPVPFFENSMAGAAPAHPGEEGEEK